MKSYCSLGYLGIFLPIAVIGYAFLPKKYRWMFLLLCSYAFFWMLSKKLLIYILISTIAIHYIGIWLGFIQKERDEKLSTVERGEKKAIRLQYQKKQRLVLAAAICFHIGLLVLLKYSPFLAKNVQSLLTMLNVPLKIKIPKFALPIGLSFYTLQAVSYMIDVYRGTIKPDQNLGRLALYMCFFPSLMEGPICRYAQTANQLYSGEAVTYHNLTYGSQRILYGLFKKIVIADRLNLLIKSVFSDFIQYDGTVMLVGAVLYTCQLYMEFSGTMDVVIGSAEIFDIHLPENFQRPFFSKTISEFWQRWHITLGLWFKDYIFYPVSMSKRMKKLTMNARKKLGNHYGPLLAGSIALFCVWICNGLWHGSGWNYIFFGLYHFFLILSGSILEPTIRRITDALHIKRDSKGYHLLQIGKTTIFVIIGELFFRANGLTAGLAMFKKILTEFSLSSFVDGTLLNLGMDLYDYVVVLLAVLLVLAMSILKEKGISIRDMVASKPIYVRWAIYYSIIMLIIIFGAYGEGYAPIDPIYANF